MKGIYMVGGYPDMERFLKYVEFINDLKFDFIEIGIPFSEPVADGSVISKAIEYVLKKGFNIEDILNFMEKIKKLKIKKYIMTYSNIVYSYGLEKFSNDFGELINSIIIADLPNKLHNFFYNNGFTIPIIPFVTPESRSKDIENIKELKGDFIYFVGIRGITGGDINLKNREISKKIEEIKKITDKKVIIGFGLKNAVDAEYALTIADGYVIGTEVVKRVNNLDEFEKFLRSL